MLGEFLTKVLVVLFGYAYPAFECFKMVEQRPGEIEQLRFWCQYWINELYMDAIHDLLHVLLLDHSSNCDNHREACRHSCFMGADVRRGKARLLCVLMYPKTKGSDLVYDTFLRPLVMQYEPDIEQRLRHLRAKSGQLIMFYIKNFTDKGTTLFLEALNYVVSQGSRVSRSESFFSRSKRSASIAAATKHSSTAYDTVDPTFDDVTAADPHAGRAKQRRPPYKY